MVPSSWFPVGSNCSVLSGGCHQLADFLLNSQATASDSWRAEFWSHVGHCFYGIKTTEAVVGKLTPFGCRCLCKKKWCFLFGNVLQFMVVFPSRRLLEAKSHDIPVYSVLYPYKNPIRSYKMLWLPYGYPMVTLWLLVHPPHSPWKPWIPSAPPGAPLSCAPRCGDGRSNRRVRLPRARQSSQGMTWFFWIYQPWWYSYSYIYSNIPWYLDIFWEIPIVIVMMISRDIKLKLW